MPWRLPPLNTSPKSLPQQTETAALLSPAVGRWKKLLPLSGAGRTYEIAVRHLEAGQWESAIASFEKIIARSQGGPLTGELARFYGCEAHLSYAVSLFDAAPGDASTVQKALLHLERAAALGPHYADVFYQRGRIFLHHGQEAEAIAALDKAVDLNPGFARAHLLRGILLYLSGEREGGLLLVEVAASMDASLSASLLAAARAADAQNDTASALRLLRAMNDPDFAAAVRASS